MELRDYLAVLRRSWLLIALAALGGAMLGALLSMVSTPLYQASAQMFVSMASDGSDSAYTGALFAQQRVKSYTAIVDSPGVLEPVIDSLELRTTPSLLAGRVTATAPPNTVLINVSVTDADPEQAALIANAVSDSFAKEITRLETPAGGGSAPVKPSVTKPAVAPLAPVSPRTNLNLALGALLGLLLGVGIAVLRHVLDTSVTSTEELTEAAGATLLGTVGYDSQAKSRPLVALDHTSVRSEAFRSIRTNLQYVNVDNPPRTVVMTSALPGEGKSTTTANLAITLAQAGARVLLVEADLRRPRVAEYLGVDGSVGLTDVLIGRRTFQEVLVSWNRGLLDVLPSGAIPPNPSELLGSHLMGTLLDELVTHYQIVLIDAPPLLPVTDAAVLTKLADGAILIARHGTTTREQVGMAADSITQVGGRLLGVVLNFMPMRSRRGRYGAYGYGYGYGDQDSRQDAGSRRPQSPGDLASPSTDAPGQSPVPLGALATEEPTRPVHETPVPRNPGAP